MRKEIQVKGTEPKDGEEVLRRIYTNSIVPNLLMYFKYFLFNINLFIINDEVRT